MALDGGTQLQLTILLDALVGVYQDEVRMVRVEGDAAAASRLCGSRAAHESRSRVARELGLGLGSGLGLGLGLGLGVGLGVELG